MGIEVLACKNEQIRDRFGWRSSMRACFAYPSTQQPITPPPRFSNMQEIAITPEIIAKHGLTPEEFERIKKILGREPNITELGIFSVMWSEHCSYKNSRRELKKFPTTGPNILVKAGEENAGVVDKIGRASCRERG